MVLTGIILFIYQLASVYSAHRTAAELCREAGELTGEDLSALLNTSEELKQLKDEELWLGNRITAARSKLFTLEIDLPDSLITVSINGVSLYNVKAVSVKTDRWINNLPAEARTVLSAKPALIARQYSSFEKEPIVIRQAPRDTIEAAAPQAVPDTSIRKPVMLLLSLENNLNIAIMQDDHDMRGYRREKKNLLAPVKLKNVLAPVNLIFHSDRVKYQSLITLEVPARNCETLYRAIPDSALVLIKINP